MLASESNKHWKTGYVSGAFDMFHIGHLNLIRRSKERCDRLIVGVLSDEVIERIKKKCPVIPLDERMEIIGALKYADEVTITTYPLLNKVVAWEKYKFDAMFSGDDHKDDGWAARETELKERGADLVYFPYTKNVSTTALQNATLLPKAENADMARRIEDGFRYLFPFDKVSKGERIVIYGAGDVGTQYAKQLGALNFCKVVAFADTYAKLGSEIMGIRCLTPGELKENCDIYDRIVIASTLYHARITDRLRVLGISPERIV